jgi:hypothetical protein
MFFVLSTPDYNKSLSNTTKVKVYLRNGIAEILDQHQDLMGQIENNLIEIEANFENKLEKFTFVLQDAVFVVSNKGLDSKADTTATSIYVYARNVREINSNLSLEELNKQYEKKNTEFETELTKIEGKASEGKSDLRLNSKTLLLKNEVEFLRRAMVIVKNLRS